MINRAADPRTDDTLVYELLRTPAGASEPSVIGTATFRGGKSQVDAAGDAGVAVRELLERAYVDRLQPDERPRGYRRTGRATVGMLVPGMAEHFVARLRGLWLPYPDGSVVTAREVTAEVPTPSATFADIPDSGPVVTDPALRRATLAERDRVLNVRPLVRGNAPASGLRPDERPNRSDCGWPI